MFKGLLKGLMKKGPTNENGPKKKERKGSPGSKSSGSPSSGSPTSDKVGQRSPELTEGLASETQENQVLDVNGNTTLHAAALEGDLKILAAVLRSGVDPDVRNRFGASALHAACAGNSLEVVQQLIKAGADPNVLSDDGRSCLSEAAFADNGEMIAYLLESGKVSVETANYADLDSYTPLHLAAMHGHSASCISFLKSPLVDGMMHSKQGLTAFHMSVVKEHFATARIMVAGGMGPNTKTISGETVVHLAVKSSPGLELLKNILEHVPGLDLSVTDAAGRTALMLAVAVSDQAKVSALLATGRAAVNTLNPYNIPSTDKDTKETSDGMCAMPYSNSLAKLDSSDVFSSPSLRKAVRKSFEASFASSALHMAAASGSEWAVIDLVEKGGADPALADAKGRTPLHVAVAAGHRRIVKYLVEQVGAEVESREGQYGFSPLSLAAFYCNVEMTSYLVLRGGARVNPRDRNGCTPFVIAAGALEALLAEAEEAEAEMVVACSVEEGRGRGSGARSGDIVGGFRASKASIGRSSGRRNSLRSATGAVPILEFGLEFVLPAPHHAEMRSGAVPLSSSPGQMSGGLAWTAPPRKFGASLGIVPMSSDSGVSRTSGVDMNPSAHASSITDDSMRGSGGLIISGKPSDTGAKSPLSGSNSQKSADGRLALIPSSPSVGAAEEELVPGTIAAAEFVLSLLEENGGKDTRADDARLLLSSVASGKIDQVRLLLRWVSVNTREPKTNRTPLHLAAAAAPSPDHLAVLGLLLEVPGIDLSALDAEGKSALDLAASRGDQAAIQILSKALSML